jgi:hypothetical protein
MKALNSHYGLYSVLGVFDYWKLPSHNTQCLLLKKIRVSLARSHHKPKRDAAGETTIRKKKVHSNMPTSYDAAQCVNRVTSGDDIRTAVPFLYDWHFCCLGVGGIACLSATFFQICKYDMRKDLAIFELFTTCCGWYRVLRMFSQ